MQDEVDCGCDGKPKQPKATVLSRIMSKVFVPEEEYRKRINLCEGCDHLQLPLKQCDICHCFMEAKTRLVKFHCALDKIGEEPKW